MIHQSQQEAQSTGLIRNILIGIIGTPFVIGAFWSLFMLAWAVS